MNFDEETAAFSQYRGPLIESKKHETKTFFCMFLFEPQILRSAVSGFVFLVTPED